MSKYTDDVSRPDLAVFVHLAENKDFERWRASWRAGTLVGVNDETPYGYGRANSIGCKVSFSKTHREGMIAKALRYALRAVLGFDFLHAWRQRKGFAAADIIWTHTESQYLAVAAVLKLTGKGTPIIGQTVWLIDHWSSLSRLKRKFYKYLIDRVDVLTFLSPLNMEAARSLFPTADLRFIPFGIPSEKLTAPRVRIQHALNILAIGNDRHRDWETLVEAIENHTDISLVILSGTVPSNLVNGVKNIEVRLAKTNRELADEFEHAAVVCVPLKPNLHASGITVIQEAILAGVPVIATDTGGLRSYFSDDEVYYVPASNPSALLSAVVEICEKPQMAAAMVKRAQGRMGMSGLGADSYISDHVLISREIVTRGRTLGRSGRGPRAVGGDLSSATFFAAPPERSTDIGGPKQK